MRKILITGGAGFIGSNLSLKLVEKGYHVTVLDSLTPQIHGENPKEKSMLFKSIENKVEFIYDDVRKIKKYKKNVLEQDAIIHLAAETGTGQSMYKITNYTDVNIGGTAALLELLTNYKHRVQKVIVASSRAVYGEGKYSCKKHGYVYPLMRSLIHLDNGDFECKCPECKENVTLEPTSEDSLLHPTSLYGITKLTQEQMILTICKSIGIPGIAFRYQNVYGPGQSLLNPYTGILAIFSTLIKNDKQINIFEDGLESRDFVYIDDVVNATILGIENQTIINEVYNVGSDIPISVLDVVKNLMKNYGKEIPLKITGNYRIGDIRHNYADLYKINSQLNYTPNVSFTEGLSRFCNWVNMQEVKEDNYSRSIKELKSKGLFK